MVDYVVVLSARSRLDLNAIRRWLTQPGSGLRAQLKIARIGRALTELQFAPDRWPIDPQTGVRRRVVDGHLIAYRVDVERLEVRVLRVFGPYQDRSEP